jgi:multicomponent Na+:H+ antiporter subunit E
VPHGVIVALTFAVVWGALAGGGASWIVGAPLVATATWLALRDTAVVWRIQPVDVLRFVPWFFGRAIVGGVDVLRRAVMPRMPIAPGFVTVPLRLRGDAAVLVTAIVSLSPGTLTAEFRETEAVLHVIDEQLPVGAQVRETERRVARLLGLPEPDEGTA